MKREMIALFILTTLIFSTVIVFAEENAALGQIAVNAENTADMEQKEATSGLLPAPELINEEYILTPVPAWKDKLETFLFLISPLYEWVYTSKVQTRTANGGAAVRG